MKKILIIFGTRPEAIKMYPIIKELKERTNKFKTVICITAQHREMLDGVLRIFNLKPDYDLDIMTKGQNLWDLTSIIILKIKEVCDQEKPDIVLIHGDTTTAMAAALSAFYCKIPIGHVEAGLRSFNKYNPFPEETNRTIIGNIADFHFAPTKNAAKNLKKLLVNKNIYVTGNTVIDALLDVAANCKIDLKKYGLKDNLKTILVTMHRRENHGKPMENICQAIKNLVQSNADIQFIIPVHLNPNVREIIFKIIGNIERINLIEPLEYDKFVGIMKNSFLILTDSGGIQEEAPSLQKPTLVLRSDTERPEALESGATRLIGTKHKNIILQVQKLLDNAQEYNSMISFLNPYGDGKAAKKIINIIEREFVHKPF
jgi:UDP-N-acetylglucosamine 2-epimerase (non-hydrolysing)